MSEFASRLPEQDEREKILVTETVRHRKERELKESPFLYERVSWRVYYYVTSRTWFEAFIMLNILLIGACTGLDVSPCPRFSIPACVRPWFRRGNSSRTKTNWWTHHLTTTPTTLNPTHQLINSPTVRNPPVYSSFLFSTSWSTVGRTRTWRASCKVSGR